MIDEIESNVMVDSPHNSNNFHHTANYKPIRALKKLILDAPIVDKNKVKRIREELVRGQYQASNQTIAAKMYEDLEII